MKKRYIKIPKDYFKDLKYEVKFVEHTDESFCCCIDCMDMREEQRIIMVGNEGVFQWTPPPITDPNNLYQRE